MELGKASQTSRMLLQCNGSCQTKQNIAIPDLDWLEEGYKKKTIKEGMGKRKNSKSLKYLLSYFLYF